MSGPDRERHEQRTVSSATGDCFRACMSVLLDVPNGDHLPTLRASDSPGQHQIDWSKFLWGLGLAVSYSHPKGPIWKSQPWIASVPSKNCDGCTHAIVMEHGGRILFDPSPRRRYRARTSLLGKGVVLGGTWLEVADASKLHRLVDYQASHSVTERGTS